MDLNIDDFTLISGANVLLSNGCVIRQPTLGDIRSIGYDAYRGYLSILMLTKEMLLSSIGVSESELDDSVSLYDILGAVPNIGLMYAEALSFFCVEMVQWANRKLVIGGIVIDEDYFPLLANCIAQISYISAPNKPEKRKFASAKAREIYEKLEAGRARLEQAKRRDSKMELPNLISAVAAMHGGYTLSTIWELTVYQLYDQFARLDTKVQMSIYGQRWAAWGEDAFDTTLWFQSINTKKEGKS